MEEIVIKVDIPVEFKEEFRIALSKVVEEFIKSIKLMELKQMQEKIGSREEQEIEELGVNLGKEVNKSLHKKYKNYILN